MIWRRMQRDFLPSHSIGDVGDGIAKLGSSATFLRNSFLPSAALAKVLQVLRCVVTSGQCPQMLHGGNGDHVHAWCLLAQTGFAHGRACCSVTRKLLILPMP